MKIKADPSFDYFENKCRSYLSDSEAYDFAVSVTPDALAREREATPGFTDGYYEYVCMYREICRRLPEYGRMLIHSAVIAKGGDGFAFSAKSGVGKTTHILNWKKTFDDVEIINGDKPIYEFAKDGIYAYGTPWCGKEELGKNASVRLKAFCFIKRAADNSVRRLKASDAVTPLLGQILIPRESAAASATLALCDRLLEKLPIYEVSCNMDPGSARVAYEAIGKCGDGSL